MKRVIKKYWLEVWCTTLVFINRCIYLISIYNKNILLLRGNIFFFTQVSWSRQTAAHDDKTYKINSLLICQCKFSVQFKGKVIGKQVIFLFRGGISVNKNGKGQDWDLQVFFKCREKTDWTTQDNNAGRDLMFVTSIFASWFIKGTSRGACCQNITLPMQKKKNGNRDLGNHLKM